MSNDRPQDVADIIEGLGDPSPIEVYEATADYDVNYLAAAAGSIAANASGGGGSGSELSFVRQVTNAEILALNATDIELIEDVPAGQAILLRSIVMVLDTSNGAYTRGDNADAELDIGFADFWTDTLTSTWFGIHADVRQRVLTGGDLQTFALGTQGIVNLAQVDGVPFCVGNIGTAELGGGGAGNTLSIKGTYVLVPTVPFTE